MGNPVDRLTSQNEPQVYYTASLSPYLQGAEISQIWQLTNYINVKARSNTNFVQALRGYVPGYTANNGLLPTFDDTWSLNNFGDKDFKFVNVYTVGRDPALGSTGRSLQVIYLASGANGLVQSGSKRSAASLDTSGKFETFVSHHIEHRDLGQTNDYSNNGPFEEPDCIERNPSSMLTSRPSSLSFPTALVLADLPSTRDGVIEPLTIRAVVDRSSIELPFVARSIKGSLSIVDERGQSNVVDDCYDVRQRACTLACAPYLDSVGYFGVSPSLINQPGAFSDAEQVLVPFADTTRIEQAFSSASLDYGMVSLFVSGVNSGSLQLSPAPVNVQSKHIIVANHGFTFSQNDNFRYDSIAFGGLLK